MTHIVTNTKRVLHPDERSIRDAADMIASGWQLHEIAKRYCRGSMRRAILLVNAAGRFGLLPAQPRQRTFYETELFDG